MTDIVVEGLTASDAEQALAEIWSLAERFNLPSPKLSIVFSDNDHRLGMRVKFEEQYYDNDDWWRLSTVIR
jgi:hypothetical protein